MPHHTYDITVVVTAHAEGILAHRTMRSVILSADDARDHGIAVEVVCVLDAATADTKAYFDRYRTQKHITVVEVEFCNASEPRNFAVTCARGRWIAILDGDDLISKHWLRLAYIAGQEHGDAHVALVHSAAVVFDGESLIMPQPGSTADWLNPAVLVESNYWNTPAVLAPTSLFKETPYVATPAVGGFGYEDWHFFMALLAKGVPIVAVPETVLFVRRKRTGSNLMAYITQECLIPPSSLLNPLRYTDFSHRRSPRPWVGADTAKVGAGWIVRTGVRFARRFPMLTPMLVRAYRLLRGKGLLASPITPPSWVVAACQQVALIEPLLQPCEALWAGMQPYSVPPPMIAPAYTHLCEQVHSSPTHIFLVPWLKMGGSDLETLNYVRLVAERAEPARVLVIATEDDDNPWATRLPPGVTFIDFHSATRHLTESARRRCLATFLVQSQPQVIHNINSRLGYDLFVVHGRSLKAIARLFTSVFCLDLTVDGAPAPGGYLIDLLPRCVQHLSGIFADNRHVLDWLQTMYGIPDSLLHVHYQPVESSFANADREVGPTLHILWAGRLDRQKRPDILVEIANHTRHLPVRFHVYGSPLLDRGTPAAHFRHLPNVTYRGHFDGFASLPLTEFGAFLHTAQWEGLPNTHLEAMMAGLPVVTSDVGGISELITHDVSGLLVSPFDNIALYVSHIERLLRDPGLLATLAVAGRQTVAQRHHWAAFSQQVAAVTGYMPTTPSAFEHHTRIHE